MYWIAITLTFDYISIFYVCYVYISDVCYYILLFIYRLLYKDIIYCNISIILINMHES